MKTLSRSLQIIAGWAMLSLPLTGNAARWQILKGARANFTIDGMMGLDVNGTLEFTASTITFDPAKPQGGAMDVTLGVATIKTGIAKRDKHLRSDDFFAVTAYPQISFHATSVKSTGNGAYEVAGSLKIKSATHNVSIPFTFAQSGDNGTFSGDFRIRRTAYQIGTGKEKGMGDEVKIRLNVPVKKVG